MFSAVITALAFILTFVVVGLVVVAAAFGGGRKDVERAGGPSRRSRRTVAVLVGLAVAALGVVIPGLVIAAARNSEKAPGGVNLTAADESGQRVFAHGGNRERAPGGVTRPGAEGGGGGVFAQRCATCHTLGAAKGVGRGGPSLDQLRPPKALVLDAIQKGRARGQGQMPAGLVDGQDAQDVAGFVGKVAGH